MSESEKALYEELRERLFKIKDSNDFVLGVCVLADNEDGFQRVIDFLNEHPDADDQDVMFFAWELDEATEVPVGTERYEEALDDGRR